MGQLLSIDCVQLGNRTMWRSFCFQSSRWPSSLRTRKSARRLFSHCCHKFDCCRSRPPIIHCLSMLNHICRLRLTEVCISQHMYQTLILPSSPSRVHTPHSSSSNRRCSKAVHRPTWWQAPIYTIQMTTARIYYLACFHSPLPSSQLCLIFTWTISLLEESLTHTQERLQRGE